MAVTDHNVIEGAFVLQELAPERVIVGEEVITTKGELIGYFMTEWVPPGLEPMEVIHRMRKQGAVISVPHPFDTLRSQHWALDDLEEIAPYVDAIEIFNARCLSNKPNDQAAAFAQANDLLATVGSDAHSLWEVGRAALYMPGFSDSAGFLEALKSAQPVTRLSPPFVHLFSRYASTVKRLRRILNQKTEKKFPF
jgi:predicted metal-dependent phosphoesterase TrpH